MKRFFQTLVLTVGYCIVWGWLEIIIDGQITNRPVDNIMMLLFIPMIYKAMEEK